MRYRGRIDGGRRAIASCWQTGLQLQGISWRWKMRRRNLTLRLRDWSEDLPHFLEEFFVQGFVDRLGDNPPVC